MDFVPAKKDIPKGGIAKPKSIKVEKKAAPKPIKRVVRKIPPANPLLDEEIEIEEIFAEREEPKKTVKPAPKPAAKPKPVMKPKVAAKPKPVVKSKPTVLAKPAEAKKPGPLGQRAKFINTNKIEKRPLSAVAARKKPVITPKAPELEKKPKAPEKIIAKPEKDSKAGLIIAIILTIILGAAAGTVAFLLLPK